MSKSEQRRAAGARWGLVNSWAHNNSRAAAINAKAETIDARGAFLDAFTQRRCVVPADGFYDTGPKTARRPIRFHRNDASLILFAGLYESWQPALVAVVNCDRAALLALAALHGLLELSICGFRRWLRGPEGLVCRPRDTVPFVEALGRSAGVIIRNQSAC